MFCATLELNFAKKNIRLVIEKFYDSCFWSMRVIIAQQYLDNRFFMLVSKKTNAILTNRNRDKLIIIYFVSLFSHLNSDWF